MGKGHSLTSAAYESLRGDILTGRAEPGQRMNIVEWSARMAVSPGAVREALSRLTAEGLIHAEPQRGFRVAEVSAADLRELTEARIAVEERVVRLAIARGDVAWEACVVAAHHALGRTAEHPPGAPRQLSDAWATAHGGFHEALVAGCGNRYLLDLRRNLYAKSERYRRLSVPLARTRRAVADEHRAIRDAVLARDAKKATALLAAHLEATTEILLRRLFGATAR